MKKLSVLLMSVLLVLACSSVKNFVKSPSADDPVIYGSEEMNWCSEYSAAASSKQIVGGMNCEMVQDVMGAPIMKKEQANNLVVWEYADRQLYFIQDLLISWREK